MTADTATFFISLLVASLLAASTTTTTSAPSVAAFTASSLAPAARRRRSGAAYYTRLASSVAAAPPAVNGATTDKSEGREVNGSVSAGSALDNIRLNVNEKARTVTSVCTSGTLCTVSAHEGIEGAPFGSFVDYVLDDAGNPVLLMNEMSMHTINIQQTTEATGSPALVTLFTQLGSALSASAAGAKSKGLQDVSRCSLTGTLEKIDPASVPDDMDVIRMRYSLTHTYADQVMDSPKFAFYRLKPSKIYFVGGFGVLAKWVDPQEYQTAAPDILATEAADILGRINRDHGEDLRLTAEHILGVDTQIERIRVTNVDRLGMDVRVTSQMGTRRNKLQTDEFRIGFRIPVISVEDAKSEILKTFQEAWEKANGFSWGDGENDDDMPGATVPFMKIAADSLE